MFQPGAAINYLAAISVYILIPEFFLFRQWHQWSELFSQKRHIAVVAIALLLYTLIAPPYFIASGQVIKIAHLLSNNFLMTLFYYALALWSCIRFSQLNLIAFFIMSYGVIMTKAYPGADKYIFPIVVVFWFMKALGILDSSLAMQKTPETRQILYSQ